MAPNPLVATPADAVEVAGAGEVGAAGAEASVDAAELFGPPVDAAPLEVAAGTLAEAAAGAILAVAELDGADAGCETTALFAAIGGGDEVDAAEPLELLEHPASSSAAAATVALRRSRKDIDASLMTPAERRSALRSAADRALIPEVSARS